MFPPTELGDHYYLLAENGTGLNPTFDFRTGVKKGDSNGFIRNKKLSVCPPLILNLFKRCY